MDHGAHHPGGSNQATSEGAITATPCQMETPLRQLEVTPGVAGPPVRVMESDLVRRWGCRPSRKR